METQQTAISMDDNDPSITNLLSNSETLMSDEHIAEELQLQEALLSSFTTFHKPSNDSPPLQKPTSETAESSKMGAKRVRKSPPRLSLCEICAETKDSNEMFPLHCTHNFCTCCISKHVSIIIKKMRALIVKKDEEGVITCPVIDCTSVLEIETLRAVLPADVVTLWDDVLCESTIPPEMKSYCPYKDCSGLLERENDGEVIRESECPFCHRLFCAKCNVAWHSGVDCDERERLKEEERERECELKLHDLAKKSNWQRCPNCKFYVEKTEGCLHMTCRSQFINPLFCFLLLILCRTHKIRK